MHCESSIVVVVYYPQVSASYRLLDTGIYKTKHIYIAHYRVNNMVLFHCDRSFFCFSSLNLSLLIAKHQSREIRKTSETQGLCAGILCEAGRFAEVQSSIS